MAQWEVLRNEGVQMVHASLHNETIRSEAGALSYMHGDIALESRGPGAGGLFKALASGESIYRPTYTGTGEVFFEPSFANFHIFELGGREWILERGAYWASDGAVEVDVHRERALTSVLSGQGVINFQTKVRGRGNVVVVAQGDVQELFLSNDKLVVDGVFAVARTGSLEYRIERVTKSLFGSMSSGEGLVSTFTGTGTVLIAPVPYWRYRLMQVQSPLSSSTAR